MATEVIVKPQPIVLEGPSEESGFDTADDALVSTAKKLPETVAVEAKVEPPVIAAAPETPPVKYAQLTEQEVAELKTLAGRVPALATSVDKVLGTMGNAQQIAAQITAAQAATPAGITVELNDELFAEMKENFPELADMQRSLLERMFKAASVKGTGAVIDPEAVGKAVTAELAKRDMQSLERAHPNWKEEAGQVAPGQPFPADNPFHAWLATQSEAYRTAVTTTDSALDLKEALDSFKASKAVPPPTPTPTPAPAPTPGELRAEARRANFAATVTPKGDGRPPSTTQPMTEEDGFNSV